MSLSFHDRMIGATRLVRTGRLGEATSLIQQALGGSARETSAAGPETHAPLQIEGTVTVPPPGVAGGPVFDVRGAFDGLPGLNPFARTQADPRPASSGTAAPGSFTEIAFANEAGARPYKLYVPRSFDPAEPAALVVMLHGCTQSPDDFAAGTRMNELAERDGTLVCYPGQTAAANGHRCWNWFKAEDQSRGRGEPAIVAGITRDVMKRYAVDPRRVYVAGLSAGGALAATMGQTYPELYAAVGVHSGLACGAARDMPSAFAAMRQGGGVPRFDRDAAPVPTIVFHGDRDTTVNPVNATEVATQILHASRVDTRVDDGQVKGGHAYRRTRHLGADGKAVVEVWAVQGAGHAWSGGSPAGSYTDPQGPDASAEMMRFFSEQTGPAGTA